jgi:hypothetical protein
LISIPFFEDSLVLECRSLRAGSGVLVVGLRATCTRQRNGDRPAAPHDKTIGLHVQPSDVLPTSEPPRWIDPFGPSAQITVESRHGVSCCAKIGVIGQRSGKSSLMRIATHILAFEGDGKVTFFAGNFDDYEADKTKRLGDDVDKPKKFRKLQG